MPRAARPVLPIRRYTPDAEMKLTGPLQPVLTVQMMSAWLPYSYISILLSHIPLFLSPLLLLRL